MYAIGLFIVVTAWIWGILDCLQTPERQVRGLPKLGWLITIALLSWLGALAWWRFGRPRRTRPDPWASFQDRVGVPRSNSRSPIGPDDDPDFLNRL